MKLTVPLATLCSGDCVSFLSRGVIAIGMAAATAPLKLGPERAWSGACRLMK